MALQKLPTPILKLCDEEDLMQQLILDTFDLIKYSTTIESVKKLTEIYEILNLNAAILEKFKESELTFDEIWFDPTTLKYLNHLRSEVAVYHHSEFPVSGFKIYDNLFRKFLQIVWLRLKNLP